jgi:hypothetical protein
MPGNAPKLHLHFFAKIHLPDIHPGNKPHYQPNKKGD